MPLVLSTGGLMARATADELKRWQGEMELPVWDVPAQDDDPALPGALEGASEEFPDGKRRL